MRRCRDHPATIVAHAPAARHDYAPPYRLPREAGDRARLPAGSLGVWARPPRPLTAAITQRMGWPAGPRRPAVPAAWAGRPRRLVFLPLRGTAWPGTREPSPALLLPDRRSAPAPTSWRGSLAPHPGPVPARFGIQPGLFHDTIDLLLRSAPFTLLALQEPFNDIHDPPPPRRQSLKNPRYLQGPGFILPRRRDSLRQYRLSFPIQSPRFLPPARGPRIKLAVRRRPFPARFSPERSVFPAAGWRADGPLERPFVRPFHDAIAARLAWRLPVAAFHLLDQPLDQPLGRPSPGIERETAPPSAPPPATASSGEPRPAPIPAVTARPGAAGQAAAPARWTSGRGPRHLHLQARLPAPAPRVAEPPFLSPPPWTIDHRVLAPAVGFGPFPFGFPRPLERPSRFWLLHAPPDLAHLDRGGLVDWPRPYLFTRHLRLRGPTNLRAPRRFLAPELRVGVHFPFGMPFGLAREQRLVALIPRRPHFLQELSPSPLPPIRHWREPPSQLPPATCQRPVEPPRPLRPGTVPYHHPSAPLPEPGLGPTPRNWPPSANVRATQSWLRAPLPFPKAELPPGQPPADRPLAGQPRSGLDRRPTTVWELPPRPAPTALRLAFHRLAGRFLPKRIRPAASDFPMACRSQPTTFWTEVAPPFLPHLPWLQLLGEPTLSDDGEGDDVRLLQISVSPTLPVLTIAFPAASRPAHPWNPDHPMPGDIPSDRARRVLSFADRLLPGPVSPQQEERRAPLPWSRLVPQRLTGLPDPEVPLHRRVLLRLASRFASGAATEVGPRLPPPPPATWMTDVRLPPILHASAPHWTITPGLSTNLQIVPDQRSGLSVTLAGHDRRPTVGPPPVDRRPLAPIPSKRHQASRLPVLFRTRRPIFSIRSGPPAFPPVVLRWPRWSSTDRPLPGDYLVRPLPTPPFVRPGWTFLLLLAPASPLPALGSEPPAPHLFPALPIVLQPLEKKRQAVVAGPRHFRQKTAIEAVLAPRLPSLPDWMELPGHAPGDQIRLRFPIHL
ncbi:MAG: hypothetical protein OZSIB_4267 [Candidatus Ozemobacter sibiricus]|uniref:Uncharacterized protein n=1 Tax=Candidatus Ozemobacter sibiricus TaxID=2268124 RepID=A0A367ZN23_9BACT|nr:MAG: hypothetical protein OZSIB_4267 [Candidatus Ozemobacter sibiricus]